MYLVLLYELLFMKNINPYEINQSATVQLLSVGLEQEKVLIIDDFMQSPEALIELATTKIFTPYNTQYPGIKSPAPEEYTRQLLQSLAPLINQYYDLPLRYKLECSNSSFSLVTCNENELSLLQRAPHRDSSNSNQFAVLLYLCAPNNGGTSFYRHNLTQFETISPAKSAIYDKIYADDIIENGEPEPRYQQDSDRRYSKIGEVNIRFNRLVIYRSWLLHSARINPHKSIDANPRTGRLTLNSFLVFS
jgi:hypothetical protein